MSSRRVRFLVIAFFLSAGAATGQTGTWLFRGPQGGSVYCLAADPSNPATLYAGTEHGVYKSDDGGASWRASNAGVEIYRVQTIAIDPVTPTTLFAGTITPDGVESVGIFKSTDAGATWTQTIEGLIDPFTGIAPLDIEALAFDPRHPGTIWAGSRFSEIFESTDAGATWQPRTFGGYNVGLETSSFTFDPASPSKVLAASSIGLLRTTDGGSTWDIYGTNTSLFSLSADPTTPATLYAGNTSGDGVLKSTDGGGHWTSANKGLPVNGTSQPLITALAVDPSHPTTVYAATYGNGLFQSADGAATWTSVGSGMRSAYVWGVLIPPGQSSTVLAGTAGAGVYQSADSGKTFSASNNGLSLTIINAIVPDAASTSTYYAAAFDGIYRSADGGATWLPYGTGFPLAPALALVSRAGIPQTLFAGTRGAGLWKSSDGGATWTSSSQGLLDSYVSSIAIDPSAIATLYAGTSHPYDGSNSQRIYKSTDGGATWTQTSLDAQGFSITAIAINPAKTSQVIGVSHGALGFFQSLDSGKTWSAVSTDINCGGVNGVFFDSSGSTTYLAGSSGLCRSTDAGKTWTVSSVETLASIETLVIDSGNPSLFYAGAAPAIPGGTGGVFKSVDGGQTWQTVGTGLDSVSVVSLIVRSSSQTFLAGTRANGVAQLVAPQDRQSVELPTASDRVPRFVKPR
jgi:photosystem II stability/assembly factor-like uncharacterized protein